MIRDERTEPSKKNIVHFSHINAIISFRKEENISLANLCAEINKPRLFQEFVYVYVDVYTRKSCVYIHMRLKSFINACVCVCRLERH